MSDGQVPAADVTGVRADDHQRLTPDVAARARLTDGYFYTGETHDVYAALRRDAPVYRDPVERPVGDRPTSSSSTSAPIRQSSAAPRVPGRSTAVNHMIDMDNPAHIKRRGLVSKGFTPRRIAEHEPRLRQLCDDIIDTVCERGRPNSSTTSPRNCR